MFLDLLDPDLDPLVRGTDPDQQKNFKTKKLGFGGVLKVNDLDPYQNVMDPETLFPTLRVSTLLQQPTLAGGQPDGRLVKGKVCFPAHQIANL
jgi:hypothetical protein